MPRFYFDLSDGTREPDDVGTELGGEAEANTEAIRFLGEVLKHEPERLANGTLRVDVRDERRERRCTIEVQVNPAES